MHVWRADLTSAGDELVELLSAAERKRAAALVGERQRLLWSRSRGVLRELLGRYRREDPRGVEIAVGAHGKPRLAEARASSRASAGAQQGPAEGEFELHFNLSHSRHLALYAFTAAGPLGVDVQLSRERDTAARDDVALARRTFGEQSARRLAALDDEPRERELLRLWTRYEAELKRRGTGIGAESRPADEGLWAVDCDAATTSIVELDVAPDAAAALAFGWSASELWQWDWL